MATAHLICGLPGAGKTSFSKQLEQKLSPVVRYTHDEWMHQRHGANPVEKDFAQHYREIEQEIWQQAATNLRANIDVIMDFGFWTRQSRDGAKRRVLDCGAVAKLYWIRAADDLRFQRVLNRSKSVPIDSLYIDENAFHSFTLKFEPPNADESAVQICGTE